MDIYWRLLPSPPQHRSKQSTLPVPQCKLFEPWHVGKLSTFSTVTQESNKKQELMRSHSDAVIRVDL